MKKINSKHIVLPLLMMILLSLSPRTQAQTFSFDFGGAKKYLDNAKAAAEAAAEEIRKRFQEAEKRRLEIEKNRIEEEQRRAEAERERHEANRKQNEAEQKKIELANAPVVHNSIAELKGNTAIETKWVMFTILKGSFKEIVTAASVNGQYKINLSLRDGAGFYEIKIYENASVERYTSYNYVSTIHVENKDDSDKSFLLPSPMVQSDHEKIITLVKELTKDAQNDEEAMGKIHDYIVKNVKYDYESYRSGSYLTKSYEAVSILENPLTVCSGYANLLAAMARAYGIRAKVIHGKATTAEGSENHAWNEVYINDEWKIIDSTWNANRKDNKYYFIDEAEFAIDHIKEKELTDY